MNSPPKDPGLFTRFLFGELSEAEATQLELECLENDELFERLKAIEVEVTDQYIRGDLDRKRRGQFEKNLLSVPGRREEVELAKSIMGTNVEGQVPWADFLAWIKEPTSRRVISAKTKERTGVVTQNASASRTGILNWAMSDRSRAALFDEEYLLRFRSGDVETAKHFKKYFGGLLRVKVRTRFDKEAADEMVSNILATAAVRIMQGEPRSATQLPAYMLALCRDLMMRSAKVAPRVDRETIARVAQSEEEGLGKDRAKKLERVLARLSPLERGILVDLFNKEHDREAVCKKYQLSREQLRLAIFRARTKFRKAWDGASA